MKTGLFILVEGLDGAGKTTALELFRRCNPRFHYLKGAANRTVWLGRFARKHPRTPFFLAELVWNTFTKLEPLLLSGQDVIMDKYFYFVASHVPEVNTPLNQLLIRLTQPLMRLPQFVIFLTVAEAERIARLKAGEVNRHHAALVQNPKRIAEREEAYLKLIRRSGAEVVLIDTTCVSPDEVCKRLEKAIAAIMACENGEDQKKYFQEAILGHTRVKVLRNGQAKK